MLPMLRICWYKGLFNLDRERKQLWYKAVFPQNQIHGFSYYKLDVNFLDLVIKYSSWILQSGSVKRIKDTLFTCFDLLCNMVCIFICRCTHSMLVTNNKSIWFVKPKDLGILKSIWITIIAAKTQILDKGFYSMWHQSACERSFL